MGALRSKEILDYEDAAVGDLRTDSPVPVDLHLYFEKNGHVMVWRRSGEQFSTALLQDFRARGIDRIWIHKQDHAAFLEYLKGPLAKAPAEPVAPVAPKVTEEARKIVEAVKASPQAKEAAEREGQSLLAKVGKAATPEQQAAATASARRVIQDVMTQLSHQAGGVVQEIWKLAELDVNLQHSVNVATYATIFALAFGRIEEDLLGDVALAALLHDLGISQLPVEVAAKAWRSQSDDERATYSRHVDATLAMLDELSEDLGPGVSLTRVRDIISQHHEKFDGSGYPKGIEGFRLDDIPQLVAMADILDSFSSGRWDGQPRALSQTLIEIQALEKAKTFPEYFNPEVFATVVRWIQSDSDKKVEEATVSLVSKKTKDLVRKVKY